MIHEYKVFDPVLSETETIVGFGYLSTWRMVRNWIGIRRPQVFVSRISIPSGPFARAGITAYTRILEENGVKMSFPSAEAYKDFLASRGVLKVGHESVFRVQSHGEAIPRLIQVKAEIIPKVTMVSRIVTIEDGVQVTGMTYDPLTREASPQCAVPDCY